MTKAKIRPGNEPTIEIVFGQRYTCMDYKGNVLPVTVAPIAKQKNSPYYVCLSDRGGHVWVKGGEFIAKAEPFTAAENQAFKNAVGMTFEERFKKSDLQFQSDSYSRKQ